MLTRASALCHVLFTELLLCDFYFYSDLESIVCETARSLVD